LEHLNFCVFWLNNLLGFAWICLEHLNFVKQFVDLSLKVC
jgi:hypothetical protein